jgi:hypothetical protein
LTSTRTGAHTPRVRSKDQPPHSSKKRNPAYVWGWGHDLPPAKLTPRCFRCHRFLIKGELVKDGPRKDGSTWYAHQPCLVKWAEKQEQDRLARQREHRKQHPVEAWVTAERSQKISASSGHRKLVDAHVDGSHLQTCPDCGYAGGRHARSCSIG